MATRAARAEECSNCKRNSLQKGDDGAKQQKPCDWGCARVRMPGGAKEVREGREWGCLVGGE